MSRCRPIFSGLCMEVPFVWPRFGRTCWTCLNMPKSVSVHRAIKTGRMHCAVLFWKRSFNQSRSKLLLWPAPCAFVAYNFRVMLFLSQKVINKESRKRILHGNKSDVLFSGSRRYYVVLVALGSDSISFDLLCICTVEQIHNKSPQQVVQQSASLLQQVAQLVVQQVHSRSK